MRIAMSGAGGTGKSTLVKAMRDVWPEHFGDLQLIDSIRHPEHIQLSQIERQSFLNKMYRENQLGDNFISSRSLYDVYAYSRQTVGSWYQWVQWQGALRKVKYDYVFYLPIEFEIKPNEDGTRPLSPDEIYPFQTELQIVLNFYHVPVHILSGSIKYRLTQIASKMELDDGNIGKYY